MRTRTPWTYQGKPYPVTCGEYIGFLYRITCTHPEAQKQYLGRKFFYFKFNTKTLKKESDWKTYKGSSKNVHAAIEQYGEEHFQFEILQLFKTKAGLSYAEIEALVTAEVLHATGPTGERLYWNDAIGNIKFIAKERIDREHKAKLAAAWTPEMRAAVSARMQGNTYGTLLSEKSRQAVSARTRGRRASKETRAKMASHWTTEKKATRGAERRKVTPEISAKIKELSSQGKSSREIAAVLSLNKTTVSRYR